jgi:hypothetical protein
MMVPLPAVDDGITRLSAGPASRSFTSITICHAFDHVQATDGRRAGHPMSYNQRDKNRDRPITGHIACVDVVETVSETDEGADE